MNKVKIHSTKESTWCNALGEQVPARFVPASDKKKESLAGKIHKSAINAEAILKQLYSMMDDAQREIADMIKQDYQIRYKKEKEQGKGSFTWFNFDKSIKIEVDMNDIVKWDGALMTEALNLLNTYLSKNLTDANQLISGLVKSAFANSKGMIDSGKVFQILKYEDKIKSVTFQKACEIMRQAQSIDKTKRYMRVWEKGENGQYRNINLNFSSI